MPGGDSGVAKGPGHLTVSLCFSQEKAHLRQCSYNRTPSAQLMWSAGGKAGLALSQSPQSSML